MDATLTPAAPAIQQAAAEHRPLQLEAVYEEYFDFVWRSLRRLGISQPQLDDAAQDVFLVAHRRLADFVPRASIKTWLFSVSVRVASDYRRKARRKGGLVPLSSAAVSAPEEHSPFEDVLRAEASRIMLNFLESLDDPKRAVFILMELEQMSAPEAARALDVNPSTVYSRMRAAREAFSRWLADLRQRETGGGNE